MKRHLGLAACLAAIALVAGCGGGGDSSGDRLSKADYELQVSALGASLEAEFEDIGEADADDVKALPTLMNRLGEALDSLADGLDELSPPEDVEAEHDRIVDSARTTAEEARSIASRIENESLADLTADPTGLDISQSESFLEMQKAMTEIQAKGYDFGESFGG